jgi:acyl carrier protein
MKDLNKSQTTNSTNCTQVQTLVAEAIQVPSDIVSPDLAFGDLPQWDSLGHMEVMMRLEEEFGIEISAETIAELISIPEICAYLEKQATLD